MSWTFTFNPVAVPQLLVAAFLLVQGIIVLAQNRRSGLNRSFFLFEFAVFVWLLGMGASYLSADEETAFLFSRIGFLGVTFIPVTTYLFSVYYAGDERQKIPAFIGLAATFLYDLFINSPVFAAGVYLYSWGYYVKLGPLGAGGLLLFVLFVPLFIRNFYRRYAAAAPHQKRWHYLALLTGGLAFLAVTDFLPALGIVLPFPPLGFLFVGSLATLMGYFLLRYRLIDIQIIIGRTVGHLLLTFLLLFVYGSLFVLISPFEATISHLVFDAALFIAALYVFVPLKERSQRIVDELFAKERINFDKLVNNFTVDLRNLSDTQTLLAELFNFLTEKIRVENGAVYIFEPNGKRWAVYQSSQTKWDKPRYRDTAMPPWSEQFIARDPLFLDGSEYADLSGADPLAAEGRKLLREAQGIFAFPLVHRGLFLGFLTVGERMSKKEFSREELNALGRLVASLAIAWENARAFEAVRTGNKSKNDFVTIISHQLRTPLTNIKWTTESLLADAGALSGGARNLIARINASVEAMVRLIGQLLSTVRDSREESGVVIPPRELRAICEAAAGEYEPIMERKKIILRKSFQDTVKPVRGNKEYLQIVLATLLDNAVRYTNSGGAVRLSFGEGEGAAVEFEVSDTGIGIPEEEQPRVFEKFFRAGNAISAVPGGTGLGLYYAKTLVEAQGGAMWFRSVPGKGTTFYFTLPVA